MSLNCSGQSIFTFVVVSILFTVSMIFLTSPRVERGVCYSRRRLQFKLVYSPLFLSAWLMLAMAAVTVIWVSPVTLQFFFFSLCVLKRCPLPIFRAQA